MALTLRPDYPPIHYELARAFLAQGKLPLARQALHRFLELEPRTSERGPVLAVLRMIDARKDTTRADSTLSLPARSGP